jgi:hypothetical protein
MCRTNLDSNPVSNVYFQFPGEGVWGEAENNQIK